jgi:hypothetical protein
MENALATKATMMVSPQTAVLWPHTGLPFEQRRTHQEGQQVQAHARQPTAKQEVPLWRSKLTGKQAATMV